MDKGKKTIYHRRFVCRRSCTAMKVVLIAVLVCSMAALTALGLSRQSAKEQTQALQNQAAALEAENSRIAEDLDGLGTLEGTLRIAREELGLVDPDTVIFQTVQPDK